MSSGKLRYEEQWDEISTHPKHLENSEIKVKYGLQDNILHIMVSAHARIYPKLHVDAMIEYEVRKFLFKGGLFS